MAPVGWRQNAGVSASRNGVTDAVRRELEAPRKRTLELEKENKVEEMERDIFKGCGPLRLSLIQLSQVSREPLQENLGNARAMLSLILYCCCSQQCRLSTCLPARTTFPTVV